jgi:16S rRNA (cytosine967-C5)-methyltransferase
MNSREIILKILIDINANGAYSNISINRHLKNNKNIENENFIREIVYGVIENKLYLDYIISQVSKTKIDKIHSTTLEILRMGVYQIIFMDKIPDRASVNESVNLSKKYGHKGIAGFVNGVLRNISRNKEKLMEVKKEDKIDFLSIKYSYPKWIIRNWIKEYNYEFTEEILKGDNSRPKLNIRVNTLKINRDKLLDIFSNYGFNAYKTKYAKDGLIIENPSRINSLEEYKKGYFTIQDESSMLVSQIIDPVEGYLVLDLCSAPGGKSTHMGQLMKNNGKIISRDIYEHKLQLVENNANRLGIDIIETETFDAIKLDKNLIGKVDYCIIDAPCSGLGIIRRRPEIKWNRIEKDIEELKNIQWEILNNAKDYLKIGGIMVYSTCTISKGENENMVEKFLLENKEFQLVDFYDKFDSKENISNSREGHIQLFPHIHNTDGFFISKLKKINN